MPTFLQNPTGRDRVRRVLQRVVASTLLLGVGPLLAQEVAADAPVLWQVAPLRPRVLDTCGLWRMQSLDRLRADITAKAIATAYEIRQGSTLLAKAAGEAPAEKAHWGLADKCFVLTAGDKVLTSGAFVFEFSARVLRIPVLVLPLKPQTDRSLFELQETFPAPTWPH